MLRVSGLSKRFGNTQALSDVSLEVPASTVLGFLGPNGSGKTTTMRSIMGLISIDAGEITWDGAPVTAAARRAFGYMPAERGMYPKMRVAEQLEYFARLAGRSAADARVAAMGSLDRLGLGVRRDDEVQALSSGNQQRLQLAIALVHQPRLLILDEPFSGLDPIAVEAMKEILREQLDRGVAVLLSSHQLDLVSDVCREVVIVSEGRVVLTGEVAAIREASPVRDVGVTFAAGDPSTFRPPDRAWELTSVGTTELLMRVPDTVDVGAVFEAVRGVGPVSGFSFSPPQLSDVFVQSVGARPPVGATVDGDISRKEDS